MDKCWNVDRIADVSGDGINDVIAGTLFSNNRMYFLNGVNGEILKTVSMNQPVDALASIADITGDGSMEAVVGERNGKVTCLSGGPDAWTFVDNPADHKRFFTISANPNPFINSITVNISAEKPIACSMDIFTIGGRMIHSFGVVTLSEDTSQLIWDGKDQTGNIVKPGLYLLVLSDGIHHKTVRIIKQ
jgi:hypothetical protein